jgi:hypothetical protein
VGWGRGCAREEAIEWKDAAELVFEAMPVRVWGQRSLTLPRTTLLPPPLPTHT